MDNIPHKPIRTFTLQAGSVRFILAVWFAVFVVRFSAAQDMYKALMREHNMYRAGVGLQASDPAGISIQVFRGFFCSNSNGFATYGVWELNAGKENMFGLSRGKSIDGNTWLKGGFRVEVNYMQPLFSVGFGSSSVQLYAGLGIQTGTRRQDAAEAKVPATGGNGLGRLEFSTAGFESGRSLLFLSVYADWRYHRDFTNNFSYTGPGLGIRVRKVR